MCAQAGPQVGSPVGVGLLYPVALALAVGTSSRVTDSPGRVLCAPGVVLKYWYLQVAFRPSA